MDFGVLERSLWAGVFQALVLTWPAWSLLAAIGAVKVAFRQSERRRLVRSGILEIDSMDGRTFEKYLEALFHKIGHQVELTKYVGDYGADLVVRKDGVKTVVQAKRSRRAVGVKAVQEAAAAKGYYRCEAAMVISNNRFTRQAEVLARANGITLWDRDRLVSALLSVRDCSIPTTTLPAADALVAPLAKQEAQAAFAIESAPRRCAVCEKIVSDNVRAYCLEHAERFEGRVLCYDHQRSTSKRVIGA